MNIDFAIGKSFLSVLIKSESQFVGILSGVIDHQNICLGFIVTIINELCLVITHFLIFLFL